MSYDTDLHNHRSYPAETEAIHPSGYTSQESDFNTGLQYFGARYYDQQSGRFMSPDPVTGTPGNPQSWNRYAYCQNDPIGYVDPDGEFAVVLYYGYRLIKHYPRLKEISSEGAERAKSIDSKKRWANTHVYTTARVKQEFGVIEAALAAYGMEFNQAIHGLGGWKDSLTNNQSIDVLRSAYQFQDFVMDYLGLTIPEEEDAGTWADKKTKGVEEGIAGPLYLLLYPEKFSEEMQNPLPGQKGASPPSSSER